MDRPRSIVVAGAMIAPGASRLLDENNLKAVVVPGIPTSSQIAEAVRKHYAVAVIVRAGEINDEVLASSKSLRVVTKHGVGTENFDIESANRHGIAVMITHEASSISVAEHALALMLAVAKQISFLDRRIRAGEWDKSVHRGLEIYGKKVLMIGFGRIARRLATLLRPFDVEITALVREMPPHESENGVRYTKDMRAAVTVADIISVHCPLTPQTRRLISSEHFDLMKPTAILINTARGEIIDEPALIDALKCSKILGAGLDCFTQEPPAQDSKLLALPNLVMTPHVGWATHEAAERKGCMAVRNILSIIDGLPIDEECLINPTVLEHRPSGS